ncbi:DUF6327 family protein [uncultured Winogradskyella sp.]|uniref:DUF6327 family protein n=1 Tax=uncultured Winogradskyella sp. TaxID=395353 RepID=UPI003514B5B2
MKTKRIYNSQAEIKRDLKVLKLRQQIASEELQLIQHKLKRELQPANLVSTLLASVKKYGIVLLVKMLFKRQH